MFLKNFHVVGAQKQDVTQKVSTLLLYKTSEETQTQTYPIFIFVVIFSSFLISPQHSSGCFSNSIGDNGFQCQSRISYPAFLPLC